jgi:hypothetical protein
VMARSLLSGLAVEGAKPWHHCHTTAAFQFSHFRQKAEEWWFHKHEVWRPGVRGADGDRLYD